MKKKSFCPLLDTHTHRPASLKLCMCVYTRHLHRFLAPKFVTIITPWPAEDQFFDEKESKNGKKPSWNLCTLPSIAAFYGHHSWSIDKCKWQSEKNHFCARSEGLVWTKVKNMFAHAQINYLPSELFKRNLVIHDLIENLIRNFFFSQKTETWTKFRLETCFITISGRLATLHLKAKRNLLYKTWTEFD